MLWLTASSRRYTFLPVFVSSCAAQNRPNKCNSYQLGMADLSIPKVYGLWFIAHTWFPWNFKICVRYKSGPYLTQSVTEGGAEKPQRLLWFWKVINGSDPLDDLLLTRQNVLCNLCQCVIPVFYKCTAFVPVDDIYIVKHFFI